jgi:uncharacterized membrane protein YadS
LRRKRLLPGEDWLTVIFGLILLAFFTFTPLGVALPSRWLLTFEFMQQLSTNLIAYLNSFIIVFILTLAYMLISRTTNLKKFISSFVPLWVLSLVVWLLCRNELIAGCGITFPLLSLAIGFILANIPRLELLKEQLLFQGFYLKLGIVILGAYMVFANILKLGALGLVQVGVVVTSTWLIAYVLSSRLGIEWRTRPVVATGVSVCGICGVIASGGAMGETYRKISGIVTVSMLTVIPMIFLMPYMASWLSIPDRVAGAWIASSIDTTSGVVLASAIVSDEALSIAALVKMTQNATVGIIVFFLALYTSGHLEYGSKANLRLIWRYFPKFVLGFIIVSAIVSLYHSPVFPETLLSTVNLSGLSTIRLWLFTLAFLTVGLSMRIKDFYRRLPKEGNLILAFTLAQLANVGISLGTAYMLWT